MSLEAFRTRTIEAELRDALARSQLELHYQPIFDIENNVLLAFESLLRWPRADGSFTPPGAFIPIAERSDLIDKLGAWVLRRACDDIGALGSRYVGVNVSAAELRHADFALRFAATLARKRVDPRQITIEITETVPLHDRGTEYANLQALRALGCWVAMDDFGAGHTSLESLRKFPFNVVKIDKAYIRDLSESRLVRSLVGAICRFGGSNDIVVVAEGVETEEQLRLLKDAGCTRAQGYLLGRPAPVDVWTKAGEQIAARGVA